MTYIDSTDLGIAANICIDGYNPIGHVNNNKIYNNTQAYNIFCDGAKWKKEQSHTPKQGNVLNNYINTFTDYFHSNACVQDLKNIINKIKSYKRILFIANGGSHVGVACHMEEDFAKLAGIPCLTLSNPGYITCLGNDYGFDQIYVEWLKINKKIDDLVIAISSSGESPDIVSAAVSIKKPDLITLTGFNPNNTLSKLGSLNIHVDSDSYGIVENLHGIILHMVLDILVEEKLVKEKRTN